MTGTGASDLLSSGTGTDLPATQEAAVQQLAALKSNPEFTRRYLAGDNEARAWMNSLHEIAGRPTSAVSGDLPAHSERTIDAVAEYADLSEDVQSQLRSGQPVSVDEYKRAVQRRAQLMNDQGWVQKYLAGDQRARQEMMLVSIILASRLHIEGKR